MTTLGYDADDLPAAPRLVAWQEDEQPGRDGAREIRPLDRLIPELEEVWPQWLQQAAQVTPEAQAGETPVPPEAAPPPPRFEQEITPPSTPSFLGDVDSLAREFEVAMHPPPVVNLAESTSATPATSVDVPAAAEPVTPDMEAVTAAADWRTPQPDAQIPVAEADAVAPQGTPAPQEAPASTTPADEFAQWQTPAAAQAEAALAPESKDAGATPVRDEWAAEVAAPPPDSVIPAAVAETERRGEEPAAVQPVTDSMAPPSVAQPAGATGNDGGMDAEPSITTPAAAVADGDGDIESLRSAARAALTAGDHWAAITHYGAVLAKMQATSEGRG